MNLTPNELEKVCTEIDTQTQIINRLKHLAKQDTLFDRDDFNPGDACGGNFDDCYNRGLDDGEIGLAREILSKLGISYGA